jgi:topoisomerase IA-like protein
LEDGEKVDIESAIGLASLPREAGKRITKEDQVLQLLPPESPEVRNQN